jgi:hypothetical protein
VNDRVQPDYLPGSPYPGIDPFGYKDRNVFFARAAEIEALTRLIVLYRGVLLYSDSGTGKSSLINAGVIPRTLEEGYQAERIRVQPQTGEEIVIQLSEKVGNETISYPSIFTSDKSLERVVLPVDEFLRRLRQHAGDLRPLLVFDQFEEWVTLFGEAAAGEDAADARKSQEEVRNAICSVINDNKLPVKVLLSLREDYLAKLTPFFQQCPNLPDHYLRLVALKGDQIYQAIRGPFEKYPGQFRPEISAALANNIQAEFEGRSAGADIRLTEVQIVCRSLFESGNEDPAKVFQDSGGVEGILVHYLERSVQSLESDQQGPAVALLSRMVTSAGTRNVIQQDDLCSRVESDDGFARSLLEATLDSLERKAKLVRRERRREVDYYEIASEFLLGWIREKAKERQQRIEKLKLQKARFPVLPDDYLQEKLDWQAYEFARRRALQWRVGLSEEQIFESYKESLSPDRLRKESQETWFLAEIHFACAVLDGSVDLRQIAGDSYWRLEGDSGQMWLQKVKEWKAYFRWQARRGGWGRSEADLDYIQACEDVSGLLWNPQKKLGRVAFEPIEEHLRQQFLNKERKLDAEKNKVKLWTQVKGERQGRESAQTFMKLYYDNIVRAVVDGDAAATTAVLQALGMCKTPPNYESMVNCFEMIVAIDFLHVEVLPKRD